MKMTLHEGFYYFHDINFCSLLAWNVQAVTRGEKWVGSIPYFFKIEKKCPDFGKNALIIFIYGLNF